MKLENDTHNLENDPYNPEHGSTPSPLRLAALGRFPEDKVRPSKEFCSTWTADLRGNGELGALGDSGLLGAGAAGCWGVKVEWSPGWRGRPGLRWVPGSGSCCLI